MLSVRVSLYHVMPQFPKSSVPPWAEGQCIPQVSLPGVDPSATFENSCIDQPLKWPLP
jgi:hypothetical protein